MYVYILGGFLGSGKTTLLMKIASMYAKRGLKTAIVVNESGSVGVDGATLKADLALPHKVKDLVRVAMIDDDDTFIIGVADVQRFEDLIKKKEQFFKMQMSKADFILINKLDLAKPGQIDEVTSWLKQEYPDKPVMAISAKTDENIDKLYEMMR